MPLNKWRYVRYTDDGCGEYQCLTCYQGWEARGGKWNFYPSCGIRFDGQHEAVEHGMQHGREDWWGKVKPYTHPWHWVIEERYVSGEWGPSEVFSDQWRTHAILDGRRSSLEVLEVLRSLRAQEQSHDPEDRRLLGHREFRVRTGHGEPVQGIFYRYYGTNLCWPQ